MDTRAARRLLDEQRYAELADMIEQDAHRSGTGTWDEEARTLLLRCRLEQGRVHDARVLVEETCGCFAAGSGPDLWSRFVIVFSTAPAVSPLALESFIEHCERTAAHPALTVRAPAIDLRAQALALRFALSGQPPAQRAVIAEAWVSAASAYRMAALHGDADRAIRRAASFLRRNPGADLARARELLHMAKTEAERRGDALSAAETAFALAELDLEVWFGEDLGEPDGRQHQPLVAALEEAAGHIAAAGGRLGEPRALWALGNLCLEHGVAEGVELAEQAAEGFREADVPGLELTVWQSLSMWHVQQGDAVARAHADRKATVLARRVGHPLADDARAVSEADIAFRTGARGLADELTSRADEQPAREFAGQAVVRASVLAAMGLTDEAVNVLRAVDRDLRHRSAPAGLLPEVSLSLAGLLADSDPAAACAHLTRGAAGARDLGLPVDEARCLALHAWVAVLARKRGEAVDLSLDGTTALFDRAIALLEPMKTLDARSHLVSVFQQRGQAAFFTGDWEGCGAWLTRAEELARLLGLGPQLAFTLSYQALVLMDRARHGAGAQTYEEADRRLAEVQNLLATAGMRPEIWRTLFHRGICALETGDRYAPDEQDRLRHWSRADTLLSAAAQEIDRLRAASATPQTPALRAQHVRMALPGDKSEVYRLGFELHWYRRTDAAEALRWLERAKSRALLDGLAELTPPEPVLRGVTEAIREQHPQMRSGATDADEPTLRQDIDALLASMRNGPMAGYARAKTVEPPAYPALRAALAEEQRLMNGRRIVVAEYRCTPRETLLFGLRADWAAPKVESVPLDHARLSRYAAQYFRRPSGVRMMMQDLADGGERDWHSFAALVAPLADWARPGDIVYVVPHAILHDLPLHTLPVAGVPLLLRNPVCYSPSSAVLMDMVSRAERAQPSEPGTPVHVETRAVFGDSLGNLPRAAKEARTVARLLSASAQQGDEVTRARVLRALETCDLVHLAGHGRLSTGDGFERGMELADGALQASDLLGRRVKAATVVLSGCETGVNEHRSGDEPVGLSRALFLAGSRTVVVSQWMVADASAEALLAAFHRERAEGFHCADALHHAARVVAGEPPHRRHFYHWGAFVNVGDWR